ncbi:hypothetical protein Taro_023743 [Colocasia esculenta]|uniref:Uncharacterized protein n=1 Tax=Colocasia esculenta TaxID=4460 RepID=A0A843V5I7_COLES|nr:hypothetical protein [Colocasia esculenta]
MLMLLGGSPAAQGS